MAMSGVVFNRLPEIAAAFPVQLHKVIVQTTEIIQQLAQDTVPVDTGYLQSSIYTVTSEGSTYGQTNGPAPGDSYLLPEGPPVEDEFTGYVDVAANYGVYVEFGTRFMAAQPYFYPAVEEGRARFEAALGAMESFL
jgi:HK97 gp10 family phage protein